MITTNKRLDKEMISYLQTYDPVVREYRAFFRANLIGAKSQNEPGGEPGRVGSPILNKPMSKP